MNYKLFPVLAAALLTGAALLSSAAMAENQGGGAGDGRGPRGDRMARMQEHLQLSDEQVTQMRSIRENGGTREEMFSVLNDTQRAQFEEHRANHRGRHGKGGQRTQGQSPEE